MQLLLIVDFRADLTSTTHRCRSLRFGHEAPHRCSELYRSGFGHWRRAESGQSFQPAILVDPPFLTCLCLTAKLQTPPEGTLLRVVAFFGVVSLSSFHCLGISSLGWNSSSSSIRSFGISSTTHDQWESLLGHEAPNCCNCAGPDSALAKSGKLRTKTATVVASLLDVVEI